MKAVDDGLQQTPEVFIIELSVEYVQENPVVNACKKLANITFEHPGSLMMVV